MKRAFSSSAVRDFNGAGRVACEAVFGRPGKWDALGFGQWSQVTSGAISIPSNMQGRARLSVIVHPTDRVDTGKTATFYFERSDDGTNWSRVPRLSGFGWQGNSKLGKDGQPMLGPSVILNADKLAGKKFRVVADSPSPVRYSVEVKQWQ